MLHRSLSLRHCQIAVTTLLAVLVATFSAQAATISQADARASEPGQFDVPTLDIGVRALPDAARAGMRLTMPRMSEHYVLFLDLSAVSGSRDDLAINGEVDYSGPSGGFGLFYTGLPDWKSLTVNLRVSAHREKSEVDTLLNVSGREGTVKNELNSVAISVLFSPRQALHDNGLNAYVAAGLSHDREDRILRVDGIEAPRLSERDSQLNGTLEAGLVYPTGRFRLHAVASYHDEFSLALGLRYHLKGAAGTP